MIKLLHPSSLLQHSASFPVLLLRVLRSKVRFLCVFFILFVFCNSTTYAQLTGIKTIGVDYPTVAAAITALNTSGVGAGGVTFNVPAGYSETFTATAGNITTLTSAVDKPIIFQKSGSGTNPIITGGTGTTATDYVFKISGGDYITFDGIDITNATAGAAQDQIEYGYYIVNASATDGAQFNTIKNCSINMGYTSAINSYNNTGSLVCYSGIYQRTVNTATNATGANSNNKYFGITVKKARYGIAVYGTSTTFPDINTEIGKDGACYIGDPTGAADDIGGSFTSSSAPVIWGAIAVYFQKDVTVANCEIQNVRTQNQTYTIYQPSGIGITSITGTNNKVYSNKIHNITCSNTNANGRVVGIYAGGGTATDAITIYNNVLYDLDAATSAATNGNRAYYMHTSYILISGVTSSKATKAYIYFNSIRMSLLTSNNLLSMAGINLECATATIKNNVIMNTTPNGVNPAYTYAARRYCIYVGRSYSVSGVIPITASDYNDFYISTTGDKQFVGGVSLDDDANNTYYATLANWQGTGKDANSKSQDPHFTSATNLQPTDGNYIDGVDGTGITTDILGTTRGSAPSMGAYDKLSGCTIPTYYTVASTGSICNNNASITLSGSQSGVTYQLYKDGVAEGGTTAGTGSSLSWSVSSAATYTVKTTAAGGYCAVDMTGSATVTGITPTISSQSTPTQSLCKDATASSMSVTATGPGTLSYQWYSSTDASIATSGDDIMVGTNSSSFTPSTSVAGTLYYYCVVTNTCSTGSATATSAISDAITVIAPPSITTSPSDKSVCNSDYVNNKLAVVAAGASLSYQWQYSADGSTGWASVSSGTPANSTYTNPTTATLTITVSAGNTLSGYYRCAVSSSVCGSPVYSSAAHYTVNSAPTVAALSVPNQCVGNLLSSLTPPTVTNTYGSIITSETWAIKLSSGGAYIDKLSSYALQATDNGNFIRYKALYTCGMTSGTANNANVVTLTVNVLPSFSVQPSPTTQNISLNCTPTTLSVTAVAGGTNTISKYEWYSNTSASVSGGTLVATHTTAATTDTYAPVTDTPGTLYYYCVVTNDKGCTLTSAVSGAINVSSLTLSIAANYSKICQGETVIFTATHTNEGASPTYQWYVNDAPVGTNSDTYTTNTLNNNDYIYCELSNGCGESVTSNTLTEEVENPMVSISTSPVATELTCGLTSIELNAEPSMIVSSFLWSTSDDNSSITVSTPNTYQVTVTTAFGCEATASIIITQDISTPALYTVTGGGAYCINETGRTVGLSGSETGMTYQLRLGGLPVGSALSGTGSALDFGLQTAAGTYTVFATKTYNACTQLMTGSVSISINPLPSTSIIYHN